MYVFLDVGATHCNFQCYARQTNLYSKLTQLDLKCTLEKMKVSKQVVSSDSLFLNLSPSLSPFSFCHSRPSALASSLGISSPRREVTIVERPDFPEKGTVTTTLPTPSSTDRNESPLARSAPRACRDGFHAS